MRTGTKRWACAAAMAGVLIVSACSAAGGPIGGLPATPAGKQIDWVFRQLNGDAKTLTVAMVRERFAPSALGVIPADQIVSVLKENAIEHGPIRFKGIVGWATPTAAIGLFATNSGERAAVYMDVEAGGAQRITSLEISEPPFPSAREVAVKGPHTGSFVVHGRSLAMTCAGQGSPTVVLESGASGGASVWSKVQPEIAKRSRVCAYDRANIPGGASDPADKPRTAADVVRDLDGVLTAAKVPGPFIMVGHSNGGLFARLFAAMHPEKVVGLVLVDSVSEREPELRVQALRTILPPDQWARLEATSGDEPFVARISDEQVDLERSFAQMRTARPLRTMPLVVLQHDIGREAESPDEAAYADAMEKVWKQTQKLLGTLVPGAVVRVAEGSGHEIPQERPDAVTDAVNTVLQMLKP